MFYRAKRIILNFVSKFVSKNSSLLQKLNIEIPYTFPIQTISSLFDEMKLVLYGSENA